MTKNKLNLRIVVAIAICLAATTMFVQAQTPVTIDVSKLGGADTNNSGKSTESQWRYAAESQKTLFLLSNGGNYTLTGTNTNLRIYTSVENANVILNNVSITSVSVGAMYLGTMDNFTLTLVGTNFLKALNAQCIDFSGNNSFTITSSSGGSLVASGNNGIYIYNSTSNLIIDGDANVTAEGYVAINTSKNIKMNDAAKLTMKTSFGETNTFEKSNAASAYKWKLTNAATSDPLTNAVISVTVAAGQTGVVQRVSATGINEIFSDTENAVITGYFDLLGRKLTEEPTAGIYIIRYDNLKTKKMMK